MNKLLVFVFGLLAVACSKEDSIVTKEVVYYEPQYDYRNQYIGSYDIEKVCMKEKQSFEGTVWDTVSWSIEVIEVELGFRKDYVFIDGFHVNVDTTGKTPKKYTPGGTNYYGAEFTNDSLYVSYSYGPGESPLICHINGSKLLQW